jgi:Concanavalin A-like lectin/glucanases superfamily/Secretion system C-terminal sorting domain
MKTLSVILLLISFQLLAIAQDPVANYPFNNNANDISGNGYHGTVHGATITTDRFGNANAAYYFDGTNDYINTNTSFDFQERSVCVWAKSYSVSSSNSNVVLVQDANTLTYGGFFITFKDNYDIEATAGGENTQTILSSLQISHWYFIVLIRTASGTEYYVDNVQTGTATSGTIGSPSYPNPNLVIGVNRVLNDRFFLGEIDDILIYDYAIGENQIDSLYHLGNWAMSVPENITFTFNVSPNPTSDNVIIETVENTDLQIYDINGKLLYETKLLDRLTKINMEEFSKGVYFFKAITDNNSIVKKVLIQ